MDRDRDEQEGLGISDMGGLRDMDGEWGIMDGVGHMNIGGGGRYY